MLHRLKSLVNKAYKYVFFHSYREKPAGDVFTDIYNKKKWSGDSYSGPGYINTVLTALKAVFLY
jgi:hypothetical protein